MKFNSIHSTDWLSGALEHLKLGADLLLHFLFGVALCLVPPRFVWSKKAFSRGLKVSKKRANSL